MLEYVLPYSAKFCFGKLNLFTNILPSQIHSVKMTLACVKLGVDLALLKFFQSVKKKYNLPDAMTEWWYVIHPTGER